MAQIDAYIRNLFKHQANELVLTSGGQILLRFPSGDRSASQSISHDDLTVLLFEIADPEALAEISTGGPATIHYSSPHGDVTLSVVPGPDSLRVVIRGASLITHDAPPAPDPIVARPAPAVMVPPAVMAPPAATTSQPPAAVAVAVASARVSASSSASSTAASHGAVHELLLEMYRLGASDLHLSSNQPPMVRLHGEIQPLGQHPVFSAEALTTALLELAPPRNREEFQDRNDTDFAYPIPGLARFRANLFRDRMGPGGVFRAIPFEILSPKQLGLPPKILELCQLSKGLVVVTGPTGSGKSTTLATLVDHVNATRGDHIITIEDPIEFVHENKRCLINQREIGVHTSGFKPALRAALREDPDIVLVGEMRDLETIAIAIETAETGHLVFGTLHTNTAPSTVDRIIDQFPSDRQSQIRQMLAESLKGVIAQVLCKKIGGGRAAAYEVLIGTPAVANLIREGKTFQIPSMMQTGRNVGMCTMTDSLMDLVKRKVIEPKEAFFKAVNKSEIKQALAREGFTVEAEAGVV